MYILVKNCKEKYLEIVASWVFIVISPSNIIRNLFRSLMLMGNMSLGSPQKFWLIMHGSSHITMQFIWKIESYLPRRKPNASCCLSVAFDRGGPKRLIRQWGKHFWNISTISKTNKWENMYKIYSWIGLQHIFPIRTVRRRNGLRVRLSEHFGLTSVCKYSCAFTTKQCDTEKNIKGRAGK